MSHEHVLWIAVFAYAMHAFEEYELNWRDWARAVLWLPVDWNSFYLANSVVIAIGFCCAEVGWREPWFALGFPALMLINATLFHVLPTVATRVYSPGLVTAVVLFYPIGGWVYYSAWRDGVLTLTNGVLSVLLGAVIMASPIVLLKIKGWKTFAYGERGDGN